MRKQTASERITKVLSNNFKVKIIVEIKRRCGHIAQVPLKTPLGRMQKLSETVCAECK
jgi:hypothetical protein